MNTTRNIIILLINGITLILLGIFSDKVILLLNIENTSSKMLIIIGCCLCYVPMIIRVNILETHHSREVRRFIFWKDTIHNHKTIKEVQLFGLVPIHQTVLNSRSSFSTQLDRGAISDTIEIISAFIPIFNSFLSMVPDLKRLHKAKK